MQFKKLSLEDFSAMKNEQQNEREQKYFQKMAWTTEPKVKMDSNRQNTIVMDIFTGRGHVLE